MRVATCATSQRRDEVHCRPLPSSRRAVAQSPSVGFFGCRHAKSVALEFLRRFRRICCGRLPAV
ncbi:hypothetical protein M569_15535 [Genlisea aurea]|uniref:Uncharacterized protein n=1 Tax=Genlisea aurea TaxID=192259 RepID=S8D969_9LAMI|nr:hypothetical protein M569_15535 [Genlisea aurea]